MPFDDFDGQPNEPDDARRRMMEFILRSALKPALPPSQGNDAGTEVGTPRGSMINPTRPISTTPDGPFSPGSREYNMAVGATSQPRIPAPRLTPAEPPVVGGGPSIARTPPLLGQPTPPGPVRPNAAPDPSDFPVRKRGTAATILGAAGMGLLGGYPAIRDFLGRPKAEAQQAYQQAEGAWERGIGDQEKQAQTEEARARAYALLHPKPEEPKAPHYQVDDEGKLHEITVGPDGKPVDQIVPGSFGKPQPAPRENKAVAGTVGGKPAWGVQTDKGWIDPQTQQPIPNFSPEKPERQERPQRVLGLTPDNKVVELTPGMAVPPGTKSLSGELNLTTKTEQGEEAGKSAVAYANDYLTGKQWTGPGDEALMEKFFEMAKPSSGFRMTTPQMEMLQRSRDWMGSITAKTKHAFTPEAPWFSDTQRGQIVKTMNDLAKSRQAGKPGSSNTNGNGQVIVTDPNGGQHTFSDQASADRFKKLAGIR